MEKAFITIGLVSVLSAIIYISDFPSSEDIGNTIDSIILNNLVSDITHHL
jgi:hypothetical protein